MDERINALRNDPHFFQFLMKIRTHDGDRWIFKYDLETGFEIVTQKELMNNFDIIEFYVYPKNKKILINDNVISMPTPFVGVNLENGEITVNNAIHTFHDEFDEPLGKLNLMYFWTNCLISHVWENDDGDVVRVTNKTIPALQYGIGWKNGKHQRFIKYDVASGKFTSFKDKR